MIFGPHWIGVCVVPIALLYAGIRTRIHVCSNMYSSHYSDPVIQRWMSNCHVLALQLQEWCVVSRQFLHKALILCIGGEDRSSTEVENRPYRPLHTHRLTVGSAK